MNLSHPGNLGDIIYALPSIASIAKEQKEPINLYLKTFVKANYTGAFYHPSGKYRLTEEGANFILPLLKSQSYIGDAAIWKDELINFDLDFFRTIRFDLSGGHIPRWYFMGGPINYDLSKSWVEIEKNGDTGIVVNRSLRYRNVNVAYNFLSSYGSINFVGLEEEYVVCKREIRNLNWIKTETASELAQVIANCKLFIGNQSFPFSLAEGIKVVRVLEKSPDVSNVIPHGETGWDFYLQDVFEMIVHKILTK